MKIRKFLNENSNKDETIELITKDCQPFLKECKNLGRFLYRGSQTIGNELSQSKFIKKTPFLYSVLTRKNRTSSDTPIELHKYLNEQFKKKFGWFVRSEGVFTTFDEETASKYGSSYIFFPIDNYKYIYSNEVTDIYEHFGFFSPFEPSALAKNALAKIKKNWMHKDSYETRYLNKTGFKPKDEKTLDDFIQSEIERAKEEIIKEVDKILKTYKTTNLKGASTDTEIVFKCDEYYMVDKKIKNHLRSIVKI
jgi:hypothetical protein